MGFDIPSLESVIFPNARVVQSARAIAFSGERFTRLRVQRSGRNEFTCFDEGYKLDDPVVSSEIFHRACVYGGRNVYRSEALTVLTVCDLDDPVLRILVPHFSSATDRNGVYFTENAPTLLDIYHPGLWERELKRMYDEIKRSKH